MPIPPAPAPGPAPQRRVTCGPARGVAALFALTLLVTDAACPSCVLARGGAPAHEHHQQKRHQTGFASFYGHEFRDRRTASGERFDPNQLTAAHRTLPFGTRVKVTNLDNGRHVVVRINDRGPYMRGRVLDLSPAAARKLGFVNAGVAHVRLDVLECKRDPRGRMATTSDFVTPPSVTQPRVSVWRQPRRSSPPGIPDASRSTARQPAEFPARTARCG